LISALLFGLAASSALLIGAALGSVWDLPKAVTGVLLAFASGALISALAFELFEEANRLGGGIRSGLGLLAGAAVFVAVDTALDRYAAERAEAGRHERAAPNAARSAVGFSLLAAVTLDGIPENLALGVSLLEGTSLALLVAIFFSNLPESLVGAAELRRAGRDRKTVMGTWVGCAVLLATAVVAGRSLAQPLDADVLSLALAFAGGAVIASLADTLMPEAYESGGPSIALATAAGFLLSFELAA
jgi:ZIP family zinc transporter